MPPARDLASIVVACIAMAYIVMADMPVYAPVPDLVDMVFAKAGTVRVGSVSRLCAVRAVRAVRTVRALRAVRAVRALRALRRLRARSIESSAGRMFGLLRGALPACTTCPVFNTEP